MWRRSLFPAIIIAVIIKNVHGASIASGSGMDVQGSGSGSSLCSNSTTEYHQVIKLFENLPPPIAIVTLTPLFGIGSKYIVNVSTDIQLYTENTNNNVTIYSNSSFNYSDGAFLNITYMEQNEIDGILCTSTIFIELEVLEDIPPNCTTSYILPCYINDTVVDFRCNSSDHPQLSNVTYSIVDHHYEIDGLMNRIVVIQPIIAGTHSLVLTACSGGVIPKCNDYNITFTLPELLYFPNNTYNIMIDDILQEDMLLPNGTFVCIEYLTCNDTMESTQYSVSSDNGPFSVFENGSVYVTSRIDYNSSNLYNLSITCNNSLSEDNAIVSISNRRFEFINTAYFVTLPENVSSSEIFLNVTLKWYPTSTVTYNVSDSLFNIDSTGGISVSSTQSLDHESSRYTTITVTATALYAETTATIMINVTDVNDNQPMFNATNLLEKNVSITESLGSILLNISATDNDTTGVELRYVIEDNDVVDIHPNNGSVYVNTSILQCYAGMNYVLKVTVTDSTHSNTINITLQIGSLTIMFDSSSFIFNVTENVSISTEVHYLNASVYSQEGIDIGGSLLSYSISSEYFYIDPVTGVLYVSSMIDRELTSVYDFEVSASLQCPNRVIIEQSEISIFVTDENDNRPAFNISFIKLTIDQNISPANVLYSALAVDDDISRNSQVSKYFISRSFNDLFRINSTSGNISVSKIPTEYRDYLFDVLAEDDGSPSLTSYPLALLLSGLYRNESSNVHFEKDFYIFNVTEEDTSINSFIGEIRLVYDQNPEIIQFTCFNCDNFTTRTNSNSMEIYTKVNYDREWQSSYAFSVSASVGNFETIAQTTVLIIITDINDNMPMFSHSIYTRAISNDVTIGAPVVTISATDQDTNENGDISYSLEPNNTGFGINADGSIVTRYTKLESGFYNLTVVATDKGINQQLSSSAQVRITVFNQTKNYPFNSSSYQFTVEENSNISTIVGSIFILPNFTYQLVHKRTDSKYCFNLTDGVILITCEMDREMIDFYYFQVEASSGDVTSTANVLVTITDLNDNSPVFEYSTYSTAVSRSLPSNTIITTFKATDVDIHSTVYYYHDSPEIYFKVNRSTGEMTFNETNIEGLGGSYSSSVVATDGTLNSTVNYTIFIPYFNEEPLEFDQSLYAFNLTENSEALTKLGTLVLNYRGHPVNENDIIAPLSFEITDDSNKSLDFYINQAGELLTLVKTDREAREFYNFTVTGYYGSTFKLTAKTSVLINIHDVNDVIPRFNQNVYLLEVNNTLESGNTLLNVTASDNDYQENGTIIYTIRDAMYISSDGDDVDENLTTFVIDDTLGIISLQSSYHPTGQYRLIVVASDNSSIPLTSTALVLLNILDPIPTDISFVEQNYNFSVSENVSLLTHIGSVSVIEMNHPGLQGIYYNITGGNGSVAFFIDPFSGVVMNAVLLDRETHPYYTLRVTASAIGVQNIEPSTIDVFISVEDVNDEIPLFSKQVYNISRSSTESNSIIVNATATDKDIGDNARLTYTIVSDGSSNFTIDNSTGVIYDSSMITPAGVYPLRVSVTDHGLMPHTSIALVLVTIYHIPPDTISFTQPQYIFNITENSQLLTMVGNISIEEIDHPGVKGIEYNITGGNGSEAFIVSSTGTISNTVITDREKVSRYTLTVEATVIDAPGIAAVSAEILINVIDVNDEAPVFAESVYRITFNRNVIAISSITTVSANDADIGSNARITYRIFSSNNQPFQINSTTGEIQNTDNLILESSYILYIEATDQGIPPNRDTAVVFIFITLPTITELNFPQTSYAFSVHENARLGTSLGSVTLYHHNGYAIEDVTYSINSTVFVVDGNNGEIYTRQQVDYETVDQYSITLTAVLQVNDTNITASTLVRVNVIDENDNTPVFTNLPNTIAINEGLSIDDEVFQVRATDSDSEQFGIPTFSLTDEHFGITPEGMVLVKGDIDRETQDQYTLLIMTEDGEGLRQYAFLTINILDINDNIPVLLTGNGECFVHERVENSSACSLIFIDHDLEGNGSVRVTDVSGGGYSCSVINDDVHDNIATLLVLSALDYETTSSINITIQFEDQGVTPNVNSKSLIIQVIDEPDNAPAFVNGSTQQVEVRTIVTNGSRIFSVLATDEDDDLIQYSIVNVNPMDVSGRFHITPFTGTVLIVALDPPFESGSTVNLTISATDNSVYNLSSQSNVSISIIPNTLTFTDATYEFSLFEEMRVGTTVGRIQIDRDSQATDIELTIDPNNVPFSITPESDDNDRILNGLIRTTEVIDRDSNGGNDQFTFSVIAQRTVVSETATATVTINIQDENDNSPVYIMGDEELSIDENVDPFTIIGTISATDIDRGRNGAITSYELLNDNQNFTINNNGVLRSNVEFDYETKQTYDISIAISDGGQPSRRSIFPLVVQIINLNDNLPKFNHTIYFADIKEGERVGYTLLNVIIEDKDLDPYSIRQPPLVNPVGSTPLRLIFDERNRLGSSYPIILSSISQAPQSAVYSFTLQATDGGTLAEAMLYVGVFTQNHFIQFFIDIIPEREIIAGNIIGLIGSSLFTVYGRASNELNAFLYSIEPSGDGRSILLFYVRNGDYDSGGPIETPTPVMYIPLDDELAFEINRRISEDEDYAKAGVSFIYGIPTPSPSETPTNKTSTESPTNTQSSSVQETFITSATGFGAIAGAVIACLALITCIIVACVCLRIKQRADDVKAKSHRHDPYSPEHQFKNYKRKSKVRPSSAVKKPNHSRREDRMELFNADELSRNAQQLAVETMFQDEMLPPQTMPWWDPGYLANSDNVSQVSASSGLARATVDGDKRKKRTETSDYGSSVDPAYYLTSDQSYSELDSYDGHMSTPNINRQRRSSLPRYEWKQ